MNKKSKTLKLPQKGAAASRASAWGQRRRLVAMGAPAAGITFGLFVAMGALIAVDFTPVEAQETREIPVITPQKESEPPKSNDYIKPAKIEAADQPPPPPKLTATKSDVNLPTPQIQGAAPQEISFGSVQSIDIQPIAIIDRDAEPIRPPVLVYPVRALERGIQGDCQVRFDVDVRGKPYNIQPDCTDTVFQREAIRAINKVEFAPKIVRGQAQERRNVVYPLSFTLKQ